jgi:hypothetical protein
MIRFYREIVTQIIAVLQYLQKDRYATSDCDVLIQRSDKTGNGPQTLADLTTLLEAQLAYDGNKDSDLLDALVATVKLPYNQNRWGHDIVKRLRRVLLIPNEYNALIAELKRQEFSCTTCGREFLDRQLTVFLRIGDNVRVSCTSCVSPQYLSAGLHKTVNVTPAFMRALGKNILSEEAINVAAQPDDPGVPNEPDEPRRMYYVPPAQNARDYIPGGRREPR